MFKALDQRVYSFAWDSVTPLVTLSRFGDHFIGDTQRNKILTKATATTSPAEDLLNSHRYFLNVLAVTATLNANSTAKGNTTNEGCKLKGKAR